MIISSLIYEVFHLECIIFIIFSLICIVFLNNCVKKENDCISVLSFKKYMFGN